MRIFAVAGARSPRAIVTTKGPIKKPEDLKGMRLRIPPIPIFRETFEALGVKVVPLGLNEVYMALSRGQVDGQDNGFDLTLTFRFHEVSKYWSATDHVYDIAAWYISERRWKTLTKEQQDLFKRAAQIGGKVATDLGEQFDRAGHGGAEESRRDLRRARQGRIRGGLEGRLQELRRQGLAGGTGRAIKAAQK